jgi:hypothetical protein
MLISLLDAVVGILERFAERSAQLDDSIRALEERVAALEAAQ